MRVSLKRKMVNDWVREYALVMGSSEGLVEAKQEYSSEVTCCSDDNNPELLFV